MKIPIKFLLAPVLLFFIDNFSLQAQQKVTCNDHEYAPVCGVDGRSYLNACYAKKFGVTVRDTGNSKTLIQGDTLTWPIRHNTYRSCNDERIKDLKDGTYVYKQGSPGPIPRAVKPPFVYYRGDVYNGPCPVCLPPNTLISTPNGDILIKDIKEGDEVWTMNEGGKRVAATVLEKNIVKVENHKVLKFALDDGRTLEASPMHPAVNNIPLENFQVGDKLDGATIVKKELIAYKEKETRDILPSGTTGYYWANHVLIGSTLKESYKAMK